MKKKKSPLPKSVSESEFIEVWEKISKKLSYKFKFGYHSHEDMKQQAAIFALEGLKNYDHNRPLENFLWTHDRNRLFNYKRDNYQRPDKPCNTCEFNDPKLINSTSGCAEFCNKNDCLLYSAWLKRNDTKKNIMKPVPIESVGENSNELNYNKFLSDISNKEIIDLIESKLNGDLREIYLKLKNGCKVNKADRTKLFNFLQDIIPYE